MNKSLIKYISSLLLFGSNGIVANFILLSSYEIVFLRTLIGSIFLFSIIFISGENVLIFKDKRTFFFNSLSGISMGLNWMFLYEAYKYVGVGISTLLCYCGPIIVLALSPFIFKENLTLIKFLSFISVLTGIILITGKISCNLNSSWGFFCGAMSAVMYALMIIFNKKLNTNSGVKNTAIQLFMSFLTVLLFMIFRNDFSLSIATNNILPILILGIINTGTGCYLYFSSIGYLPIQTISILGYLEPLSAVILSSLFLHESMSMLQVIGTLLIIGSATITEFSSYSQNNKTGRT